jgi:phospholipase C
VAKAERELFAETAIVVTFDEGGGYDDGGSIRPVDFFGDGPRIPAIMVSPFSTGGRVVHTYCDHVAVVKFIERNWRLAPLTNRSRDNLPNPRADDDNPYVPTNMPAVGCLFDMFDFDGQDHDRDRDRSEFSPTDCPFPFRGRAGVGGPKRSKKPRRRAGGAAPRQR